MLRSLAALNSFVHNTRSAKTLKETCELAEAGFDYFTTIEDVQIARAIVFELVLLVARG